MATKVYTKSGDKGQTSLVGGQRIPKSSPLLEAYGTVDELNSHVGLAASLIDGETSFPEQSFPEIHSILNTLFNIGSHLACIDENTRNMLPEINEGKVSELESAIDKMQETLPELKNFILPTGHITASQFHICRTVCRRAERLCIQVLQDNPPHKEITIKYLNRLSDYLFVAARYCNHLSNNNEYHWSPK